MEHIISYHCTHDFLKSPAQNGNLMNLINLSTFSDLIFSLQLATKPKKLWHTHKIVVIKAQKQHLIIM